jgi:hypothetical protein
VAARLELKVSYLYDDKNRPTSRKATVPRSRRCLSSSEITHFSAEKRAKRIASRTIRD